MTLAEFIAKLNMSVSEFEQYWRAKNKGSPNMWPVELGNYAAWMEQFTCWSELAEDAWDRQE